VQLSALSVAAWIFLPVFIFVSASAVQAAPPPDIFHVSPTGVNDASRAGSESEPWRTINYALSRAEVGSGDVIVVNSAGIDGNGDYVEVVTVDKSVKIRANSSDPSQPVVRPSNASFSVFIVTADGVEISGLRIYGSEARAAIRLNNVSGCLIEGNSLGGPDESKRNYFGVWVDHSSQNVVRNNTCQYNKIGIDLYYSSANIIYNNSLQMNSESNINFLYSHANLILGNTLLDSSGGGSGLHLEVGWQQNIISGNSVEGNGTGVELGSSTSTRLGGIITANRFLDNTVGLYLPANALNHFFFLNHFENDTNVDSAASEYPLSAWGPLFYQFSGRYFRVPLGNYYSDYAGSDSNGDGIGETSYGGAGYLDHYPLVEQIVSYKLFGWNLGPTGLSTTLNDEDIGGPGKVLTLAAHAKAIFSTAKPFGEFSAVFPGSSSGTQPAIWNGWLTFASPPAADHSVSITFGSSKGYPSSFEPSSASADISGDGTNYIFFFTATPGAFRVQRGRHLAVCLENMADTACMFYAPAGSHPYSPLSPLLLLLGG